MLVQIKIKGALDRSWSDWLGNVDISTGPVEKKGQVTTLTVDLADQAALFGILDSIRDLNLPLLSVVTLESQL